MLTLLAVLVMLMVIFGFSAENAVLSSERSGSITMRILDAASRWFHIKISQSAARGWQKILETPLRKSAHFMEYALLSYLVNWHMLAAKMYKEPDFFIKNRKQAITILKRELCLGLLFCVCYAISDELHQLFVPGRAGRLFDVCVDGAGACFGMVIFLTMPLQKVTMIRKERKDAL